MSNDPMIGFSRYIDKGSNLDGFEKVLVYVGLMFLLPAFIACVVCALVWELLTTIGNALRR